MSATSKELMRFRLIEEIGQIEQAVAAIGRPADMTQRSLIARYGKLLLLSQRLLRQLPKLDQRGNANPFRSLRDADPVSVQRHLQGHYRPPGMN